ncbi:MAG: DMT family transporter, partial [Gammaproteobacteria bacterium]|nr:DMT family transporter [Gammaproteobacteria bacterium]
GALGAIFVLIVVILFPKVGAMNVVILVLIGQTICSLLIDQYGWFNAPISPINLQKIAALILMLVAVLWFQKSRV